MEVATTLVMHCSYDSPALGSHSEDQRNLWTIIIAFLEPPASKEGVRQLFSCILVIYIYIYTSSNISYPTCNPLCLWIMCVKRKHHAISVLQSNNIFEWKSFPSRIPMCLYHELRIAHQKKLPVSGNIISGAWCPQKHGTLRADSLQVLGSKDGVVVWEVAPHYTNE